MNQMDIWGFKDPKVVGESEYSIIYEFINDLCDDTDLDGDERLSLTLGFLGELVNTAQYLRRALRKHKRAIDGEEDDGNATAEEQLTTAGLLQSFEANQVTFGEQDDSDDDDEEV